MMPSFSNSAAGEEWKWLVHGNNLRNFTSDFVDGLERNELSRGLIT
jgi:hypothetical protein